MDDMLSYALDYAKKGIAVFPLKPRDKAPFIMNGFKKATTDEMQIETWWKQWPDANIGIATGQMSNGICVIDLDLDEEKGKNGIKTLKDWQDCYGTIKPTVCATTGRGGWHIYFRADEEVKCRINFLPGVDIRGDGGYVVAPPSFHSNGNQYTWKSNLSPDEIDFLPMDDNIRFLLHHKDTNVRPSYIAPDKIPEGERNGAIFRFACMMQAKGASDNAVFAATKSENDAKCNPPLSDKEINQIVNSALKYEKGKPIYFNSEGEASQGKREPVFSVDKNGKILKTWENIREAIEYDPELFGHIQYNQLACSPWVFGELPWEKTDTYRAWSNADDSNLKAYLEKRYNFNNGQKIMEALEIVVHKHCFNPICDELNKIYEDYKDSCKGSIKKLLPHYLGADDNEYNFEALKIYMLGAISRAFHPGCKFDYTLIIYGDQGAGKSEFIRHLAICPEWFNDNFNTFDGDKASEKLAGMWMVELAELKALKSAKDSESIKSFLTSRYDTYRGPWERRSSQRPRMCVFAGTTNNMNVFVDRTGNRRFLPIISNKQKKVKDLFEDIESVDEDFRKAWAEAMEIYHDSKDNPPLILPKSLQDEAVKMQERFLEDDYRIGIIQAWLDNTELAKVCVPQIIELALHMNLETLPPKQKREILEIMDSGEIKGWERLVTKRKDGRSSFGVYYGNQIGFIRSASPFD